MEVKLGQKGSRYGLFFLDNGQAIKRKMSDLFGFSLGVNRFWYKLVPVPFDKSICYMLNPLQRTGIFGSK
jgi:hypothetical protein